MGLEQHLEKLRYFYEVGKAESIKEGATHLNLTQPSVSKAIKILEESIDTLLFVRRSRGVNLTREGKILFNYCHGLFASLNDIEARLITPEEPMAGVIRVGTYDSIAIFFWPTFLKAFLEKYPLINLELTTGRSRKIQKEVEEGKLDLALIVEPRTSSNLETIELKKDQFNFYVSSEMTDEKATQDNTPLIYMPDALAGQSLKRLSHTLKEDLTRKKQFKTSSLEAAKEMILQGLGVGLLPSLVADEPVKQKRMKPIDRLFKKSEPIGIHSIGLVFPKHKKDWSLLKGLISEIKSRSL